MFSIHEFPSWKHKRKASRQLTKSMPQNTGHIRNRLKPNLFMPLRNPAACKGTGHTALGGLLFSKSSSMPEYTSRDKPGVRSPPMIRPNLHN